MNSDNCLFSNSSLFGHFIKNVKKVVLRKVEQ